MAEVYLYGSTRLPKLPERDAEKYPYAFIYVTADASYAEQRYDLYFLANRPINAYNSIHDNWLVQYTGDYQTHQLRANGGADWTIPYNSTVSATNVNSECAIIWSNIDILNEEDGSVDYPGSSPVLVEGAWENQKAPLYLYSGHSLPQLPEWDKTTYPYAVVRFIESQTWYSKSKYVLYVTKERPSISGNLVTGGNGHCYSGVWALHDGSYEWARVTASESTLTFNKGYALWTNTDILNEDGTVYLAASDPVPILSTDHTAMVQGWIVGKRLSAMRGKA